MKKVAIQGTLGSYHDIAAHKYFEGEEIQDRKSTRLNSSHPLSSRMPSSA